MTCLKERTTKERRLYFGSCFGGTAGYNRKGFRQLPVMNSSFRSREMNAGSLLVFFYACERVTEFRMSVLSSVKPLWRPLPDPPEDVFRR